MAERKLYVLMKSTLLQNSIDYSFVDTLSTLIFESVMFRNTCLSPVPRIWKAWAHVSSQRIRRRIICSTWMACVYVEAGSSGTDHHFILVIKSTVPVLIQPGDSLQGKLHSMVNLEVHYYPTKSKEHRTLSDRTKISAITTPP